MHRIPSPATCLAIMLALASLQPGAAVRAAEAPAIGGFMDLQWSPGAAGGDDPVFSLGQAEVGLAAAVNDRTDAALALAWDPDTDEVGLGCATVNLRFGPGDPGSICRHRHLPGSGILAGRFDVPFGVDWLTYPSIDRPLISAPLAVDAAHGSWNADGVLGYASSGPGNVIVHATGGFDRERALADGSAAAWTGRQAFGGRIGAVPVQGFAPGLSAAWVDAVEDGRSLALVGLDLTVDVGRWFMRAEWLQVSSRGAEDHDDHGWYAAVQHAVGPGYGILRWDEWRPEGQPRDRRLCLGAGLPVGAGLVLRAEYEWWPDEGRDDRLALQAAAAFGN